MLFLLLNFDSLLLLLLLLFPFTVGLHFMWLLLFGMSVLFGLLLSIIAIIVIVVLMIVM